MALYYPDEAAHELGMGRNQFFSWLRVRGYTDGMNRPVHDVVDAGYLVPRHYVKDTPAGPKERIKPMVTERGLARFRNQLREEQAA